MIPATTTVEVPARSLGYWHLGPISLQEVEGRLTAITTMKRGDALGVAGEVVDLRSMDLVGDLGGDAEALVAIGQVMAGLELLAGKLMDKRGLR